MEDRLAISAIIFTKNEERNIAECINSLSAFQEILVVDSKSSDNTTRIATEMGAKIVHFDWNGRYPKKRQWSLENIKFSNPWILFVDADERITDRLVNELAQFMHQKSSEYAAGSIPIDYYFAGRRLKFGQRPRKTILLRPEKSKYPELKDLSAEGMGELEGHYQPSITGKINRFSARLIHNDNDPISTWMIRHVNYAKWEAFLLRNQDVKHQADISKGRTTSVFHKIKWRPLVFFIYSYFLKLGFLDGKAGFDYAFAKSWYYWLSQVISQENSRDVEA